MNFISVFMAFFSVLGALDLILNNKFGIGEEFVKGFKLFGIMVISMIGMIVLTPFLQILLQPILDLGYKYLHIEPSLIPAMLFANDMGGASLAHAVAKDGNLGMINALVVSSMLGCTISFTLPFALGLVKEENHNEMLFGFLCGIITIPIGCFVAGLSKGIGADAMLLNILPLICFSLILALCLLIVPKQSISVFGVLGKVIRILIIFGLALGIIRSLTGIEIIKNLTPIEEGGKICFNACIVLSGAFPFMHIVSKVLAKPLKSLSKRSGINEASAFGFLSSLVTNVTTFEKMNDMDKKGVVLNSAFAISASFVFGGHLGFTMSFDAEYVTAVIIGKIVSGMAALILSGFIYSKFYSKTK